MYRIETADNTAKYEGLRALWCEVFGDEPDFVDGLYGIFGAKPADGKYISDDIIGYVMLDDDGSAVSALSCFRSGEYEGRPVYTSYAVCTKKELRGMGLAGKLLEHVRDAVIEKGGVSLVSPAEPSLEQFYAKHGYEPFFYALQQHALLDEDELFDFDEEDEEYEKFVPEFDMKPVDAASYNRYREAFLVGRPHVELSEAMMTLVYSVCEDADGNSRLFAINRGDAICAVTDMDDGMPIIIELILNPVLAELSLEIDAEIAGMIAKSYGTDAVLYRSPGPGACQSMAAGVPPRDSSDDEEDEYGYIYKEAYFGFPID